MTSFIIRPNESRIDFPTGVSSEHLKKMQQDYIDQRRSGSISDNLDWNDMIKVIREEIPNAWIDGNYPEVKEQIKIEVKLRHYENPRGSKYIVVGFDKKCECCGNSI